MSLEEPDKQKQPREIRVSDLLAMKSLSPSLVSRIRSADVDQDGFISSREVIYAFLAEHGRNKDVLMLRRIAVCLCLMILIVLGTMGGAIYGLVEFTKKVNAQDNYLVSKQDGMPLSSSALVIQVPLSNYMDQAADLYTSVEEIRIEGTEAQTSLTIGNLTVSPSEQTVEMMAVGGYGFLLNSSGFYLQSNPEIPSFDIPTNVALNAKGVGAYKSQITEQ